MLLLWTWLGLDRPIGDGDESVHAQILREMVRSADYMHTRWYGVVLYNHPPVTYWLAAPLAQLVDGEIGVRLSSALMSFATLVLVYRAGCRLWGDPNCALTGTIVLAAAPSYHVFTRTLLHESPLVLALTVALIGTLQAQKSKRGLWLAACGLGAAFAVKSFAAAVPLLALSPWLLHAARRHGDRRSNLAALALFCALALSYFVLGLCDNAEQFLREHVGFHLLQRAQGSPYGAGGGLFAYARLILRLDGPLITTALVVGVAGALWIGRAGRLPQQRALLLLGGYALTFFIGMSLIRTRLPHYILPLYPPAMLAFSGVLTHARAALPRLQRPLWRFAFPALAWVVLLASTPYSAANDALFERPYGKILGLKARALRPDERLYVYEWYGVSLGYYADHRVVLLTARPDRYASINFPHGIIARAHAAALVPPSPAPAGSDIIVAGHVRDLDGASWLEVRDVLAAAPPYFLARASVRAHADSEAQRHHAQAR